MMFNLKRQSRRSRNLWSSGDDGEHTLKRLQDLPEEAKFQPLSRNQYLYYGAMFALAGASLFWLSVDDSDPALLDMIGWVFLPFLSLVGFYTLVEGFFVPTYFVTERSLARSKWRSVFWLESDRVVSWTVDDSRRGRLIRLRLKSGDFLEIPTAKDWEPAVERLLGPPNSSET